jgi:alkanesulfonate monooxygenase SsuD/methylene tetrahydromethanopterin reductase-like flavin-dependent oxidoreductase (luciferase family)
MRVGLALPMYELESGRTLRLAELAAAAEEAERLGFDSVWLMDHFWLGPPERRSGGHDPLVAAAYVAARTSRVALGFLVLCNPFRPVGQLAREAAALADAAPGRVLLGLGAGWSQPEFDAFGYPFERLVTRLEETLQTLPALLRGERVDLDGAFARLRDATVLTTAPAPPVWVAAFGPRMLGLAARYADGWNTAWHGQDTARFRRELDRLRAALDEADRDPAEVEVSAALLALPLAGTKLRAAQARAEWPDAIAGGPEELADALAGYGDAGADHAILNLSPRPFSLFDAALAEQAAAALPLLA